MAKILVIDDAKFIRTMLKRMIKEFGYETIEATNGREALDIICKDQPDIVITDIHMPEMDGIELLTVLRDTQTNVRVIVVSADIQEVTKGKCIELGVSEVLNKPPNKEKLQNAIEKILSKGK